MESRSHELRTEVKMHSLTVDCDIFQMKGEMRLNEAEATDSKAMFLYLDVKVFDEKRTALRYVVGKNIKWISVSECIICLVQFFFK